MARAFFVGAHASSQAQQLVTVAQQALDKGIEKLVLAIGCPIFQQLFKQRLNGMFWYSA